MLGGQGVIGLVRTWFMQIVAIPMWTNCAPPIVDLFVFCYQSEVMAKLQKTRLSTHLLVYSTITVDTQMIFKL